MKNPTIDNRKAAFQNPPAVTAGSSKAVTEGTDGLNRDGTEGFMLAMNEALLLHSIDRDELLVQQSR